MSFNNTGYLGYIPKVYASFTCMVGLATMGIMLTIVLELSSTVSMISGLVSIIVLLVGLYNMYINNMIVMELCSYLVSLLVGVNIVPLIVAVNSIDPNIVLLSFTGTTLIFGTTTGYVLVWDPFKNNVNMMYYIGQVLFTWMFLSIFATIMNIFFQSETLYLLEIYMSLSAFTLFIAYDTGAMVEKCRQGIANPDHYILDALNLFFDFANIFVKLLQLLGHIKGKESKSAKKKN